MILGGDFNMPLDPHLDTTSEYNAKSKSRQVLLESIERLRLWDIWRSKNTDSLKYTWFRLHPHKSMSQLDYFLISSDIKLEIENTGINPPF